MEVVVVVVAGIEVEVEEGGVEGLGRVEGEERGGRVSS